MAQLTSIKMSKFDNQPWGFRLQGGIDFAAPLTVQKVNGGSLAEKAGLHVGDALIRVNNTDIFQMRHKEAQDTISKAGNNFELIVSRGGGLAKTSVKPSDALDSISRPQQQQQPQQHQPPPPPQQATPVQQKADGGNVKLVNRQFNSPMGLYSEENIAETLSSQAEVLAQGVLGVNFKKNEKHYDPGNSEVFKMVQEIDRAPREPEPERHQHLAHAATPTLKSGNAPFPGSHLVGGGFPSPSSIAHPPPAGGVRIFPPGPAVVKQQVKIEESSFHEEVKVESSVVSTTTITSTNDSSAISVAVEEAIGTSPSDGQVLLASEPAPAFAPAPAPVAPAVKPVSFAPSARPTGFGSATAVAAAAAAAASSSSSSPPKGSGSGVQTGPRRGKGVLNQQVAAGARIPICSSCNNQIRGKFVTAMGATWCPDHFVCAMQQCRRPLHDIGFVEEKKELYCEGCFENYLAPNCARCSKRVKGDCLNAIGKQFHPECFACTYCGRLFGNSHFYLEDGLPYCEADWNELFTTKCYACGFPIEAGDRWVEAMNNNYHSQCFNCSVCKKNLEGQSFLGKNGRPMCKSHAR